MAIYVIPGCLDALRPDRRVVDEQAGLDGKNGASIYKERGRDCLPLEIPHYILERVNDQFILRLSAIHQSMALSA